MAHQSLYRAYRPQTFDDIVGQSHITRTLRNAIREDAVSHAYLFTGPRGTGKTTTARILAKALLCERGPTPDPDDSCEQCRDIADGRHPDVHELDAASRTQVENVREEIIGRVAYAPTRGRWKVYIIDEVQMLSTHSFNALLKTIEEPPSHTVFVLCTTHPQKVPETIHSRCQRFDFHRLGIDDIVGRLDFIARAEGIAVAEGALTLVAKHALGGMRDAISTLEQLSAYTGKDISLADVEGLLGEVDAALLFELAGLIARRDIAEGFRFVARLSESGVDPVEFVKDLVGHFRDLYVAATVGDPSGIVDTTEQEMQKLTSQAREFGPDRLARCLDLLGELSSEIRWSSDPRLALEVTLTRMARPQGELTLGALAERVTALEAGAAAEGPRSAPATGTEAESAAPPPQGPAEEPIALAGELPVAEPERYDVDAAEVRTPAEAAAPLDRAAVKRAWPAVVEEMRSIRMSRGQLFGGTEVDVDPDGETVVVEFAIDQRFALDRARDPESVQVLRRALATVLGGAPPVRYQLGRGPVRSASAGDDAAGEMSSHVDVPPETRPDETGPMPPVSPDPDGRTDKERELERVLLDDLGAEIVVDHPHDGE